jgi:hypothetical protein
MQRLRRSRVGPEDDFCEAVSNDLRVPLTVEGQPRTLSGPSPDPGLATALYPSRLRDRRPAGLPRCTTEPPGTVMRYCANWLRYGIRPKNPKAGLIPGLCRGKAHRPENLGYAGQRVLASRKWSDKTLADHRATRKAWLLAMLDLPDPANDSQRYRWERVSPADPDHMPPAQRLLHVLHDRTQWQAALAEARRRSEQDAANPSATGQAA